MRVFVTGTGRCGSLCFKRACEHVKNYTSGHETPSVSLEYPDNHIEVSPHIRRSIPNLLKKYPESKWVHLIRNKDDCVPSLAAMGNGYVMECFRQLYYSVLPKTPLEVASKFYDIANGQIERDLRNRSPWRPSMKIHLETVKIVWCQFWGWIGAEGDFEKSLECWDTPVNTRIERGEGDATC